VSGEGQGWHTAWSRLTGFAGDVAAGIAKRIRVTVPEGGWLVSAWPRRIAGVAALVLIVTVGGVAAQPAVASFDPCDPVVNPVACENSKPGTADTVWDISGAGDDTIQGYATDISVNVGQTISFKIKTTASNYTIDVYRLGWYGGLGARKIASVTPSATLPQTQPNCITDPSTQLYDCGNWAVSASWAVPAGTVSGVYVARLFRPDLGDASHITFVVRDDASTSAVLFKTSDATWQAYNAYGGADFYQGAAPGRAYKVSYNRPFSTRADNAGRDFLFSNEYPMIRFLERNGYDISYTTDVDSDRRGNLIGNHRAFVSTGHDEYWSGTQRANVEAARDAGTSLAFFSGNEVYWKTRWESSVDGAGTPFRTLVCYKETWANSKIDPSSEWTGTWRDPRFTPPSNGGRPENDLTGTIYRANHDDLSIEVPAAQGKERLWRNTSVATLAPGTTATLAPHTLGYESDEDLDNGFRPEGLIDLSTTVGDTPQLLVDFGNTVVPGTTTHHLTMYKAPSGALVFSAGTVQWAWGLDDDHDGIESPADSRMQQATMNLLADMGVQPGTLTTGLSAAGSSTDGTAPTAAITSPASGTSVANGSQVTVSGTALDLGGGVAAGVEVSTDGGTTWHPATGTTNWTYTFYTSGLNTQAVTARAIDDSGNIGPNGTTLTLNLTGPNTIFGARTPVTSSTSDPGAVEVGVKWTPMTNGQVNGIRFYKGTGNTGTHTGSLWSIGGTRLATGTFTGESASGWQTLTFASPVPVTAGTVYVASYYAPAGHYAGDPWAFSASDFSSPPLAAKRSLGANGNGMFRYGGGFPNQSFNDANYWVDVTFLAAANAAPFVISTTPPSAADGVAVSVHPQAVFSKSINPATLQFTLTDGTGAGVPGTAAYDDTSKTATFTPNAALQATQNYTASVQASDPQGHAMTAPYTWTFTTDLDPSVSKLFATSSVPSVTAANDPSAVELGVKFTPSVNGSLIGLRFYQGAGNTGTHIGNLWTASGTLLATVTFPAGSGSGWQMVRFTSAVNLTAGTTYVVSYFAPNGHYAADGNFFASTWTNSPLSAPAGSNGVYRYGATSSFPNNSYNATNYWVDPLFVADGSGTPSQYSLFDAADTPANPSWNDPSSIELGVKFTSDVSGTVTAIRFYKSSQNTGTHNGSLWTATGSLLASGTFTGESSSGWQTLTFTTPVAITAGTAYVASYHTNVGYYSVNLNAFSSGGLDSGPLHVPASGGGYHYGSGFPDGTANHNYWVDIVFDPN
jgi:hypothetical protein